MIRILVVEDAATVRRYVRGMLEGPERVVDEAVNGVEALERAAATPYDLYLVDVNMPMLDGCAFLREARRLDGPQPPAIVLTTEAGLADREQAWEAGANAFVTKPVHPDRLLPVVALLLGEAAP